MIRRRTISSWCVLWSLSLMACGVLKTPPIEVQKRDSLIGLGKILLVENLGEEDLEQIAFRFENPNGDVKNWTLDRLAAGAAVEVGWKKLDGFEVSDQAIVRVEAKGYGRALRFDLAL